MGKILTIPSPETPVVDSEKVALIGDAVMSRANQTKSLNIAILGYRSNPYSGGQGIYIKYLSKALVDAGHNVDVISGEPYPHLDSRVRLITMPGLNLYERGLGSIRPKNLLSYADIVEWISKLTGGFAEPYCFGVRAAKYLSRVGDKYDIIHDNQSLSYGMLKIQKQQPLITTLHHPVTSDFSIALAACNSWWQRILIRRWHHFLSMQTKVVRKLDNIVTVSACSQTDIASAFGIEKEKIKLIYNGINVDEFRPLHEIKRIPFQLITVASADQPLKGLKYLLNAYASLLDIYPQLKLLVIGKPKAGGDTEKLLQSLNIADRVSFISGITTQRLVELYATASIAVVPSVYEGFGLPAGEAMACEVPVISTNGGALPEVVGEAGMIVEKESSKALAGAIVELLDKPELQRTLGKAGRARIVEKFSWQVAAENLTHYYNDVILAYADR